MLTKLESGLNVEMLTMQLDLLTKPVDLLTTQVVLAEEEGFEPSTELPLCHLSRVVT